MIVRKTPAELEKMRRSGLLVWEILKKIGETSEEARILGQRDYVALGGWVKTRLKRHWGRNIS